MRLKIKKLRTKANLWKVAVDIKLDKADLTISDPSYLDSSIVKELISHTLSESPEKDDQ